MLFRVAGAMHLGVSANRRKFLSGSQPDLLLRHKYGEPRFQRPSMYKYVHGSRVLKKSQKKNTITQGKLKIHLILALCRKASPEGLAGKYHVGAISLAGRENTTQRRSPSTVVALRRWSSEAETSLRDQAETTLRDRREEERRSRYPSTTDREVYSHAACKQGPDLQYFPPRPCAFPSRVSPNR